jgi:3-hydroxybutyryl-CoA dehydrogenase
MRIAAVGAGRMGRGIAQVMAYAGLDVDLLDLKPRTAPEHERLRAGALAEIRGGLAVLAEAGVLDADAIEPIVGRVHFAGDAEVEAKLAGADVVFEGVPEVMEIKREALARVERAVGDDAIIASTTSTFSAEALAEGIERPGRFLNAHWLNPAYLVPLVEVSPSERTERATVERLVALLERAGKIPVECKPAPGYIVPRIQVLAMNEAARIVESGVASAADVDKATRYGFGVRYALMGLTEFIDFGGADILHYASRYMHEATGEDRYAAPPIIERMMTSGERGLREGKGFHDYTDVDTDAYRRETIRKFVDLLDHLGLVPRPGGGR